MILFVQPTTDLRAFGLSPRGFDPGGGVPRFDQRLDNQSDRCLALDGSWTPALGLLEAAELFGISYRFFDRPACVESFDDAHVVGRRVGTQQKIVGFFFCRVAHDQQFDRLVFAHVVPQANKEDKMLEELNTLLPENMDKKKKLEFIVSVLELRTKVGKEKFQAVLKKLFG